MFRITLFFYIFSCCRLLFPFFFSLSHSHYSYNLVLFACLCGSHLNPPLCLSLHPCIPSVLRDSRRRSAGAAGGCGGQGLHVKVINVKEFLFFRHQSVLVEGHLSMHRAAHVNYSVKNFIYFLDCIYSIFSLSVSHTHTHTRTHIHTRTL